MNTPVLSAMLTAAVFSLSACGGGSGNETDFVACTTEARASVLLSVVDASAAPIPSAGVSYQINGGPAQSQICPATGTCPVGYELSGRFTLTVSKAGYVPSVAEVQVNRDVCHVLTEEVRVVLRLAP